jgi:hypothetical protein
MYVIKDELDRFVAVLGIWIRNRIHLNLFGPPGSGYESGSTSGSFSHKCVERTEVMPAK